MCIVMALICNISSVKESFPSIEFNPYKDPFSCFTLTGVHTNRILRKKGFQKLRISVFVWQISMCDIISTFLCSTLQYVSYNHPPQGKIGITWNSCTSHEKHSRWKYLLDTPICVGSDKLLMNLKFLHLPTRWLYGQHKLTHSLDTPMCVGIPRLACWHVEDVVKD